MFSHLNFIPERKKSPSNYIHACFEVYDTSWTRLHVRVLSDYSDGEESYKC